MSAGEKEGIIKDIFYASESNKIIRCLFDKEVLIPVNSPMIKEINKKEGKYITIEFDDVTNYEDTFEKDERGKIKVDEKGAVTIIRSAKVINAFNRALAHCIAMQIRKCMLDRLTMPDIDFK